MAAVTSDPMKMENSDSRLPEPVPENLGKRRADVLGEFAQSMAENIIHSLLKSEPDGSPSSQDLDMLAEELASVVIELAVRKVCFQLQKHHEEAENLCFVNKSVVEEEVDMSDAQIDLNKEAQPSREAQSYHPSLSQSGLPVVGSLDYPDAPPTTPLIPELERSRHSFARKLKGGLAKVFLPSPPPPTPKDKKDNSDVSDTQVELMEHLMHSLSPMEAGPQQGAGLEAFAEDLSCDIMNWVLNVKNKEQIRDEGDLHLLAQQLAETIITSSLDEAKTPVQDVNVASK